jgi:hypothetical protein
MRDISDAADLIATARETFLSELLPALPKERRYVALMIANVMAIAAREHRLGSDTARSEAARLRNLLTDIAHPLPAAVASQPSTELSALRKSVCSAIRTGLFDAPMRERALLSELSHTAADWVAISNPKALRPASATSAGAASEAWDRKA